jgi:Tfp pilus assembly protein PilV
MRRKSERGMSLIEVILALGLLAGVLISVAGMFVMSERQVKSGKTATQALAVARAINEEINGWGFNQTYGVFGSDGTAATYTYDTRVNAYAGKWQTLLDNGLELGSFATINVASSQLAGGATPTLDAAKAIKVTVTVFWSEGARNRNVRVMAVRM